MVSKINFVFLNLIITLFSLKISSENVTPNSWVGSKFEIECTMCAACDNPCASPSPPPPSPPPPSPPLNPSTNCPPPPSSSAYYYPPPPPYSTSYPPPYSISYPPPYSTAYPPPTGIIGGTNPPPYTNFPAPPPPNPIVGYFPFYYHNPPPSVSLSTKLIPNYVIVLIFSFIFVF